MASRCPQDCRTHSEWSAIRKWLRTTLYIHIRQDGSFYLLTYTVVAVEEASKGPARGSLHVDDSLLRTFAARSPLKGHNLSAVTSSCRSWGRLALYNHTDYFGGVFRLSYILGTFFLSLPLSIDFIFISTSFGALRLFFSFSFNCCCTLLVQANWNGFLFLHELSEYRNNRYVGFIFG